MRIRVMATQVLLLAILAGCSMTDSDLLPSKFSHTEAACESHLGAYYLPKTYLKVVIEQVTSKVGSGPERTYNEIKELREVRKPDRSQGYCFDYRASPTAKEKVDVVRTPDFLFSYISTEALDQSAYILKTLARALFIGLSGNKDFQPFRADQVTEVRNIVFDAEFDPFDVQQSATINDALTAFQLCLVLENHTFDPRQHTINSYCNKPLAVGKREAARAKHAGTLPHVRKQARGIVYRPRLPYNLYAFIRTKGTWSLAATEIVHLENEAPNLVIGVERTFFANRRATLVFDAGSLKNVCIHKTSELEQLSTVPLEIAGSIAALPTNILQVRIENTTNHKNLVEAERQLVQTQLKHLTFLKDPSQANVPTVAKPQTNANNAAGNTTKWVALPTPTATATAGAATGIDQVGWAADGKDEWNICPKLSREVTSVLATTPFSDCSNANCN